MHAIYDVSTCIFSKVKVNVKVGHKQRDQQTNKQTGQKQYAPIISGGGVKRRRMS